MKITQVEAIELRLPDSEVLDKASAGQNCLIVKVHTDEGIVGIGEVDSCARVAKAAIEAPFSHSVASGLGRLIVGLNPLDFRVIAERLYQSTFYYGRRGVVVQAIGGIDMALWDIAGKCFDRPIYQIIGGAFHEKIRAYAKVTKQKMEIDAEGSVQVPQGPGLGVDLDEDVVDRFRVA